MRYSPQKRQPSAFTLTEVLLVIGMLALVAMLLFPVVGQMRAESRKVQCLGNLRQMGALFALYAADHGASLPMARRDYTDANGTPQVEVWFRRLFPYAGGSSRDADHKWLNCPARNASEPFNYTYAMERSAGSDTLDHTGAPVKLADLQQNLHLGVPVDGQRWLLMDGVWYFIDHTKGLNALSGAHYTPAFRHRKRLNVLLANLSAQSVDASTMNSQLYIFRSQPIAPPIGPE